MGSVELRRVSLVCLCLGALAACGSGTPQTSSASESGTGSGTSGAEDDSGAEVSASESADAEATGPETMSTSGDGDGDGDSASGDGDSGTTGDGDSGDGDGTESCPAPAAVTARFTVTPPDEIAATCFVIGEATNGMNLYEMDLDCGGANVNVAIDSTIIRKPSVGAMVELDYRTASWGPNIDRWLAIHDVAGPMGLLLGGVAASRLDPPGTTLAAFFGDPVLHVSAAQPCQPLADSCGEQRRLALDVETLGFGLSTTPLLDHGSWFADFLAYGFAIEAEEATERIPPVGCDDVPDQWFQLLVVWFPSD